MPETKQLTIQYPHSVRYHFALLGLTPVTFILGCLYLVACIALPIFTDFEHHRLFPLALCLAGLFFVYINLGFITLLLTRAKNPDLFTLPQFITLAPDGITLRGGEKTSHFLWPDVLDIRKSRGNIMIQVKKLLYVIAPKHAFQTQAEQEEFYQLAQTYLQENKSVG